MSVKVAVLGAKGRMGSEVVKAVGATDDLQIVAALDLEDSLEDLVKSGAQVVVDFTHPDSVMKNLDRKSTRLNSSHIPLSRMPSSA